MAILVIGYLAYRVVTDREGAPDPVDALVGEKKWGAVHREQSRWWALR